MAQDNYQNLGIAIIRQAIKDYNNGVISDRQFEKFIFSKWFLTLSGFTSDAMVEHFYNTVVSRKKSMRQSKNN